MVELNEIAARIRELREISDYTLEELAAELKIDLETYKKYRRNRCRCADQLHLSNR